MNWLIATEVLIKNASQYYISFCSYSVTPCLVSCLVPNQIHVSKFIPLTMMLVRFGSPRVSFHFYRSLEFGLRFSQQVKIVMLLP